MRNVVEGSIRMTGDRLTVRVSLVQADTGFPLWSESYERFAEDVFSVQQEIADQITAAIRTEMGVAEQGPQPRFRVRTASTEAYRLYLQGRFLWHQRGPDNIRSAIAFFDQAIELDPEFAAAWTGLASALMTSGTYGTGIVESSVAEVAWFVRGSTLHRRVLLVAPGYSVSGNGNGFFGYSITTFAMKH